MKVPNFMPSVVQRAWHLFKSHQNLYCYYSEFTDEGAEAQRG